MGNTQDRLVRVPNTECWIEREAVCAVVRLPDSVTSPPVEKPGVEAQKITHINFKISLANGKDISVQHHDRQTLSDFLNSIGVTWEA